MNVKVAGENPRTTEYRYVVNQVCKLCEKQLAVATAVVHNVGWAIDVGNNSSSSGRL